MSPFFSNENIFYNAHGESLENTAMENIALAC